MKCRRPKAPKSVVNGVFSGCVIIDTREQLPFDFTDLQCDAADGGGPMAVPVIRGTLASGDYSLCGFENEVAVERKSAADLFSTLTTGRERFVRELERLAGYRYAAVVVESTWEDLISRPPPHTKVTPKTVFRTVAAWDQRYPVKWWFPGFRPLAETVTFRLLERYWKDRHDDLQPADARPEPDSDSRPGEEGE